MNQKKSLWGSLFTYLKLGNGFISKFLVPLNFTLLLTANIKLFGFNFSYVGIVLLLVFALLSSFFLGLLYDKLDFWKFEQNFDYQRNPMSEKLDVIIDEIEKIKKN